ncbi:SLC13 family permease [Emcibacter sp. SYSU 3D8]|uniref:SLC13 family permease n=1 Tax=Emcibacter sp. SYSU 3D8 TaxID=3133969 RepID=UPI0031FEE852
MTLPSIHAFATILLTIGTFWLFATGKLRIELVSMMVIGILALGFYFFPLETGEGFTGMAIAFGGFGHEALVAICCLMILGRGLVVTGALEPAGRFLARLWRANKPLGMLCSLVIAAGLSMVVNDTPVMVLTLPILLNLATRVGVPASKTLMPVNCAILIGGMATTIGTSTNLLVTSIAADLGLPRFSVFHFADIALMAGVIALPYLWFVMPRLLPSNSSAASGSSRLFEAALFIVPQSTVVGTPTSELEKRIGHELKITSVIRPDFMEYGAQAVSKLEPGDLVRVEGTMAHLREASEDLKAPLAHPTVLETLRSLRDDPADDDDDVVAELVVGADSPLTGQSIKSAQIADRYGVVAIGLHRPNRTLFAEPHHSADEVLELGDVVLVQGTAQRLRAMELGESALVLEGAAEMPRSGKASVAMAIMAAVVFLASFKLMPISIAALGGSIAMIATGCIRFDRIGRALSAQVIVLVAASIALGRALMETGAAGWLGEIFAVVLQPLPAAAVLAAMMLFATLLTNFASNTAAAAVCTPIAVSLAKTLGIPAEPLVLAVLFGANLCYATPFAYQTNILIMSAGGYEFRDYLRAGAPLVVIMIVSLSVLLVLRYNL